MDLIGRHPRKLMRKAAPFIADEEREIRTSRKPVNLLCTRKIVAGNNSRMKRRNLIRINARERLSEHARFLQPFGITKAAGPSKHGNGMYHGERVCGVFDRVPDQSAFRLQGLADF